MRAVETVASGKLDLLGGEIFFRTRDGRNTSFGGSANWLGAFGAALGASDGVTAMTSGSYLRRRQVTQIGGGGALTTQTLDSTFLLRWLHAFNGAWTVKPTLGASSELTTLTRQERLGAGVLDYNKAAAGLEVERRGPVWRAIRQGVSAYYVHYHHYEPSRSPLPGLELLTDRQALDFRALDYSLSLERTAWEGGLVSATGEASLRDFPRQRVVQEAVFDLRPRRDLFVSAVLGASHSFKLPGQEVQAGLNAGVFRLVSNQNNFDLDQFRFNPNFYAYRELSVGPWLTGQGAGGWGWNLTYAYTARRYDSRRTQDSSGAYGGAQLRTGMHTVSAGGSYPLRWGFSAAASASYASQESNTSWERSYRYNYSYAYYFAGISYAR